MKSSAHIPLKCALIRKIFYSHFFFSNFEKLKHTVGYFVEYGMSKDMFSHILEHRTKSCQSYECFNAVLNFPYLILSAMYTFIFLPSIVALIVSLCFMT